MGIYRLLSGPKAYKTPGLVSILAACGGPFHLIIKALNRYSLVSLYHLGITPFTHKESVMSWPMQA